METNVNSVAVQINKEKNGYSAIALGVPFSCTSEAETYEKVIKNITEALEMHLETLKKMKIGRTRKSSIAIIPVYG